MNIFFGMAQLVLSIIGGSTLILGVGLFFIIGVVIWVFVDFILILIGKLKDSTILNYEKTDFHTFPNL